MRAAGGDGLSVKRIAVGDGGPPGVLMIAELQTNVPRAHCISTLGDQREPRE